MKYWTKHKFLGPLRLSSIHKPYLWRKGEAKQFYTVRKRILQIQPWLSMLMAASRLNTCSWSMFPSTMKDLETGDGCWTVLQVRDRLEEEMRIGGEGMVVSLFLVLPLWSLIKSPCSSFLLQINILNLSKIIESAKIQYCWTECWILNIFQKTQNKLLNKRKLKTLLYFLKKVHN